MDAPLILTLDIGSSSVRARLYNHHARALPEFAAQRAYDLHTTATGTSEMNPALLLEQVAQCVDALLEQAAPLALQIRAVAVDTFVSNILAVDNAGQPLTPLITYADTRNAADAVALRRALDEREVQARTGCLLRTSYWPARLAWLRRTRPEVWQRAARWLTFGEFLEETLFGQSRVSYSVASWGGLLDRERLLWNEPLLAHLGLSPDRLSPLVDADEPLHGLTPAFAVRWPALRDVPWFPAIGDGAAANVGSGCTDHPRMALTIGTTAALRVMAASVPEVPPGLWCYRVDRHRALLGGATSEGGNVYAWLRGMLRLGDPATVEAALAALPPDGHGLTVLPFLAGERSPGWAGDARATLHGLSLATTPLEILQASLEAVAYRCALIEQHLCGRADCTHRLIASGGALAQSPVWSQMLADVLGRPVVATAEPEATSRGVALMALAALGEISAIEALPASDGATFTPDPARHARYREAIARQQWLYERLITAPHPLPEDGER